MPSESERLQTLEGQLARLKRTGKADHRMPLLATEFDVEAAIFPTTARVYGVAQTATHNVWKTLAFASERFDTDAIHDTATNNSRLTIKAEGTYQITGNVVWDANATGRRVCEILLNGTTEIGLVEQDDVDVGYPAQCVTTDYHLVLGDYVELRVFQTSGGDLNILAAAAYSPEFMIHWVAP